MWTTGYLPPKSCTYASAASAKCSAPYPGITMAFFQNYSSPDALYQAYEAAIKQANSGRLVINTQDCGASAPPANGAEIAWNHFGLHTRDYSVQQLETGKLNAASQAAGRMFCNYNSSTNTESIIWTETDGNMLGEVTGITAPGRVELVAACAPQHRLQRTADGRHGHGAVRVPEGLAFPEAWHFRPN